MEASLPALGGMLKDRCADEKATVRRSALSALESWARASGLLMNAAQLKVIQQRCVDASPAIRKQACRSLCALLEMNPQAKELQSAWASAVLPLAQDAEPTVSEACLSAGACTRCLHHHLHRRHRRLLSSSPPSTPSQSTTCLL